MTDEELIEKARIAYVEAWEAERKKIGRGIAPPGTKSRAGIIAALAVFREHTAPADDDRETLAAEETLTNAARGIPPRPEADFDIATARPLGPEPTASTVEPAVTDEMVERAAYAAYLAYVEGEGKTLATRDLTNAITDAVLASILAGDEG